MFLKVSLGTCPLLTPQITANYQLCQDFAALHVPIAQCLSGLGLYLMVNILDAVLLMSGWAWN